MAMKVTSAPGDRQGYVKYSEVVFKERQLSDKKNATQQQLQLMHQTLTYLALSRQPSDPALRCISSTIAAHKKTLEGIVSIFYISTNSIRIHCITGERTLNTSVGEERFDEEGRTIHHWIGQGTSIFQCPKTSILWWYFYRKPCAQNSHGKVSLLSHLL